MSNAQRRLSTSARWLSPMLMGTFAASRPALSAVTAALPHMPWSDTHKIKKKRQNENTELFKQRSSAAAHRGKTGSALSF